MNKYKQADRAILDLAFFNCILRKTMANTVLFWFCVYQNHLSLLEKHTSPGTSNPLSNGQLDSTLDSSSSETDD